MKLRGKLQQCNDEYDQEVADLKSGQFCSQCNRSKTAIEKTGISFSQHLQDVKGTVLNAPQAAYDQAYDNYVSKFKGTQESIKNKEKNCESLRQQARDEERREREAAQQKIEDANDKLYEEAKKAAEYLKNQEAEALRLKKEKADKDRQDFEVIMQNYLAQQQALLKKQKEQEEDDKKANALRAMTNEEFEAESKRFIARVESEQKQKSEESQSKISGIVSSSLSSIGNTISGIANNISERILNTPERVSRKIDRMQEAYKSFKEGLRERNTKAYNFLRTYQGDVEEEIEDRLIETGGRLMGVRGQEIRNTQTVNHIGNRLISSLDIIDHVTDEGDQSAYAENRFNQLKYDIVYELSRVPMPRFLRQQLDQYLENRRNAEIGVGLGNIYLFNQNP